MRAACASLSLALLACDTTVTHEGWKLVGRSDPAFRFEVPPTWVERTPRGENVEIVVASGDPRSGANCNVLIRAEPEIVGVGPEEVISKLGGASSVGRVLGGGYPGSTILWARDSTLDGRPAVLTLMSLSYSNAQGSFDIQQLVLWTSDDGRIVQMICGGLASGFAEAEQTLLEILSTLVLEPREDLAGRR